MVILSITNNYSCHRRWVYYSVFTTVNISCFIDYNVQLLNFKLRPVYIGMAIENHPEDSQAPVFIYANTEIMCVHSYVCINIVIHCLKPIAIMLCVGQEILLRVIQISTLDTC